MKTTLSLLIVLLFTGSVEAQTFFKTFPGDDQSEWVIDAEVMSNGNSALLCNSKIIIVDENGSRVRTVALPDGHLLSYHRFLIGKNGKFYVVAEQMATLPSEVVLMVISEDGVLEVQTNLPPVFASSSYDLFESEHGIYLVYTAYPDEKPARIVVHHMAENGTEVWRREIVESFTYNYAVHVSTPGEIGIAFVDAETWMLKVVTFNEAGNRTEKSLLHLFQNEEFNMPSIFCRTPDGGYVFASTENTINADNAEILLIKTDADGKEQWRKLHDIGNHDRLVSLQLDGEGYYMVSNSGKLQGWLQHSPEDIAISRLDLNGNILWKKAFGSILGDEYPICLLVTANHLLIGGYLMPIYGTNYQGFLLKTNKQGELQHAAFPNPLQEENKWKSIKLPIETKTQEIVSSCTLPDGGLVGVMQLMGPFDRSHKAYAFRLNASGQPVWQIPLSQFESRPGALKQMPDGNFVALIDEKVNGAVPYEVVKFSADGSVLWNHVLWEDGLSGLEVLPDGSILVTGYDYEMTTGLEHIMLIKLNASGSQMLWQKWYPADPRSCRGKHIALTSDQKILVVGEAMNFSSSEKEIVLVKTDLNGNQEWIKTYKGPAPFSSANLIMETKDNHYLIGGYTGPESGEDQDLMLIKMDRSGNTQWNKSYSFNKLDDLKFLIPRGDTAWCLAGTTGESRFGNLSRYGFLANVRTDGTMNRQLFYGRENGQTTITSLMPGEGNAVSFTANLMMNYMQYEPFLGKFDPGVVTSSGEVDNSKGITLAPVPARGVAWLTINNTYMGKVRILVTGINGISMLNMEIKKSSSQLKIPLQAEKLPAGVYQVEILMNNQKAIKRMVVLP